MRSTSCASSGSTGSRKHDARRPLQRHAAGVRVPRMKFAYGPRVTGGNPAWEKLGRR